MKIAGWQKISLNDYPGKISTMLFTAGCNLRCKYCHNAELVIPEKFPPLLDLDVFFDFLKKRRGQIDAVTVSGGEPTLQDDLADFLAKIKEMGFLVKLDTNGFLPKKIATLIEEKLIDYIAMDIKAPLDKYATTVGVNVPKAALQTSIKLIMRSGLDYEFRTTMVPALLKPADLIAITETIKGAKRFFIQNFRAIKTLDPAFEKERSYTETELQTMLQQVKKHVAYCEIR